jgi:addiction module HigA family antidote
MEVAKVDKLKNIHPGEVLLDEFLVPMELSQNRVAREIGVPPRRINEIVLGKRSVTADTALRLARYFGTTEAFWMGLQADFDLEEARNRLGKRLETDVSVHAA